MNDKMLDIIGLADEKYLHEAQGKPMMKQTKHRRKIFAKVIAIAAAAAVMTVTAGAVAVARLPNKKSVEYYYNEKMASDIEQKGYVVNQVTQNEHIKMTLENMLVDENYAYGVVTVEALDEVGEKAFMTEPVSYLLDENGKYIEKDHLTSMIGVIINEGNNKLTKQAHMIKINLRDPFGNNKVEIPQKAQIVFSKYFDNYNDRVTAKSDIPKDEFEGLSLDINLKPNVQTLRLESARVHKAVISGFMLDVQYDAKNVGSHSYKNVPNKLKLNYTDGKSRTFSSDYNMKQSDFTPESGSENEFRFTFNEVLDLTKLESIEIAGETYTIK